ncbi:MAG: hypothetical protein SFX73_26155 [Kofleriaceae bacterium]|nr:hypothetical protein [Kofleriaceae bacterium]
MPMVTPRGLFLDQNGAGADEILLAISRRIAALVPQAAGAKELDLIAAGLREDRDFPALEAGLREGLARVCAALGVDPDDTEWTTDGSIEAGANAFFSCVLRWTFDSNLLDAELAIEWAEQIVATKTSSEEASEELSSIISTPAGGAPRS